MSNLTQFTTGGVKSIQSGSYSTSNGGSSTAISISTVNPLKCMVIISGGYFDLTTNNVLNPIIIQAQLSAIAATVLTLYGPFYRNSSYWMSSSANWQLIEYY